MITGDDNNKCGKRKKGRKSGCVTEIVAIEAAATMLQLWKERTHRERERERETCENGPR